jgi:peroxiredoxin
VKRHRIRWAALGSLCAVVALVVFLSTRGVSQDASFVESPLLGTAPLLGSPVTSIVGDTLGGTPVSLDALRGHVVVLSFFASWCPPCQSEAPDLETFAWHVHQTHATTSLYGVVFDDTDAAAAGFVRTYGLTYPVLEDPQGTLANEFAVTAPPVTIVLAPDLRVADVLEGPTNASQLEALTARAARSS